MNATSEPVDLLGTFEATLCASYCLCKVSGLVSIPFSATSQGFPSAVIVFSLLVSLILLYIFFDLQVMKPFLHFDPVFANLLRLGFCCLQLLFVCLLFTQLSLLIPLFFFRPLLLFFRLLSHFCSLACCGKIGSTGQGTCPHSALVCNSPGSLSPLQQLQCLKGLVGMSTETTPNGVSHLILYPHVVLSRYKTAMEILLWC